ncbi:MAG: hypothetical protein OEV44_07240 [Spirochaetota bacterium]|nr:hypothetical protein [Spirochaetota bacterium]
MSTNSSQNNVNQTEPEKFLLKVVLATVLSSVLGTAIWLILKYLIN